MQYLVTKELLALRDKYDGDFGLLDEPWADKQDRSMFTSEQMRALCEYLELIALDKNDFLSSDLRMDVDRRIACLESVIDPEVVAALRKRCAFSKG